MDKWIKKLSGAVIASVLALTLSTKASADDDKDPNDLPADPPVITEDGSGSDGEVIVEGEPEEEGKEETRDTAGSDGAGSGNPDPTGANGDPGAGSDTGDPAAQDTAYIAVDGEMIYPDEQTDINPSSYEANGFWGYDTGSTDATSDDSLYMVDCDVNTVEAHNCDLYIVSAGVNQIDTIDAGQGGNVYVSGTGIMLVDDVFLSKGKGFYLQPIEGYSGSVAVFVNTTASCLGSLAHDIDDLSSYATDGNTYILVNGSVTGILDECYVIPNGINLIMPAGTSIEMVSPGSCAIAIENAGDVTGQLYIPSSTLTIPSSSSLTVESGATVTMTGKELSDPLAFHQWAVTYAPVINVEGVLSGDGAINGNGIVALNIGETDPKPTTPAIASSVFKLIRRAGLIHYQDLDDEVYEYLLANLSSADFAAVTDNAGNPNAGLDFDDGRWGIHAPVFAFTINWTETSHFGLASESVNGEGHLSWFRWGIDTLGQGGAGPIIEGITSSTGSGILGGSGAGDYKGDMDKSKLIFGTGKSTDKPVANHSLILVVTDKETCYNLAAYYDGKQIFSLNSKVTVRFDYPVPTSEGRFFVVFRNGDGSLTAFAARYDAVTGQLVFSGDKLGDFVVVCIDDFDGQLFSEEFYSFLETISSVKSLKASF